MEFSTKLQFKVGIFIASGLVVIMGSIFMLGGDKAFFKKYSNITARFDQVQGLYEGSVVSLSGVTIGNISKISFDPDKNALVVTMRIEKQFLERVKEGSQAEIRTQGALGDKYVYILPGPSNNPPVQDGANLEIAKATDLIGIISERGKETEKIFEIINEVYRLTKTINNENRIDRLINNLVSSSNNLNEASASAKKQMADIKLKSSIDKLDSILAKIDNGDGTLGALINDRSLHDQLKTFMGGNQRKTYMKNVIKSSMEKDQ